MSYVAYYVNGPLSGRDQQVLGRELVDIWLEERPDGRRPVAFIGFKPGYSTGRRFGRYTPLRHLTPDAVLYTWDGWKSAESSPSVTRSRDDTGIWTRMM